MLLESNSIVILDSFPKNSKVHASMWIRYGSIWTAVDPQWINCDPRSSRGLQMLLSCTLCFCYIGTVYPRGPADLTIPGRTNWKQTGRDSNLRQWQPRCQRVAQPLNCIRSKDNYFSQTHFLREQVTRSPALGRQSLGRHVTKSPVIRSPCN